MIVDLSFVDSVNTSLALLLPTALNSYRATTLDHFNRCLKFAWSFWILWTDRTLAFARWWRSWVQLLETFNVIEDNLSTATCGRHDISFVEFCLEFTFGVGLLSYQAVSGRSTGDVPHLWRLDTFRIVVWLQDCSKLCWMLRCTVFNPFLIAY